eukprot:5749331-Prymnesium_polylepis.1
MPPTARRARSCIHLADRIQEERWKQQRQFTASIQKSLETEYSGHVLLSAPAFSGLPTPSSPPGRLAHRRGRCVAGR